MVTASKGRQGMVHGRTMRLLLTSAAIVALGLVCTCAQERGLNPSSASERLYVANWATRARIYIFDTHTDSLIDSTDAAFGSTIVRASAASTQFFRWNNPRCPEIWDAETISKLGDFPGCGEPFSVSRGVYLGVHDRTIEYVSFPDSGVTRVDSVQLPGNSRISRPMHDDLRELIYFTVTHGTGSTDSMDFGAWDYRQHRLNQFWDLGAALNAGTRVIYSYSLKTGSRDLFLIASPVPGPRLICLDLSSNSKRWDFPLPDPYAIVRVSSDGQEVWRAHRGASTPSDVPAIYIHNPRNGSIMDSISLRGLIGPDLHYVSIRDLVFANDGTKVYAAAGNVDNPQYSGPVYIIDAKSRTIIGTLLNDGEHYPYFMDVGPAP